MSSLVRLPSVTHSFDENQRFYELDTMNNQPNSDGWMNIKAPSDGYVPALGYNRAAWYDCPREIYMLFVLISDGNGSYIPSNGVAVKIGW